MPPNAREVDSRKSNCSYWWFKCLAGSRADKEFGVNLLADIQHIKGPNHLPVIVMNAHSADCLDLTGSRGDGAVPAKSGRDPVNVPPTVPADPANDPANNGDDPANQRRRQILAELRKDRKLRTPAIAKELGCSEKTVKRELDAVRAEGHIEFVGPTKTGYYRLKK